MWLNRSASSARSLESMALNSSSSEFQKEDLNTSTPTPPGASIVKPYEQSGAILNSCDRSCSLSHRSHGVSRISCTLQYWSRGGGRGDLPCYCSRS